MIFVQRIIIGLFEARRTKNPNFLSKLGRKSWKTGRLDNFLIRELSQSSAKFANFRKLSKCANSCEKKIAKQVTFSKELLYIYVFHPDYKSAQLQIYVFF
jgi:hypothetical protein